MQGPRRLLVQESGAEANWVTVWFGADRLVVRQPSSCFCYESARNLTTVFSIFAVRFQRQILHLF